MKKLWDKIDVKISTLFIIILSFAFGRFKQMIMLYIIACIHEIFHLFACMILKTKINKISILPFGLCLSIEEVENISSIKQIIIYLAGPLSLIFNYLWITLFHNLDVIKEINFSFLIRVNLMMCLVNLLPIFPLDGYMILKAILQFLLPYKRSLFISNIVSTIAFAIFITLNIYSFQPMISLFLLLEQLKNFFQYKLLYKKFLIYKSQFIKQKKYKIIKNYFMFKDCNNYKIDEKGILNDTKIAAIELKKYIK